MACCATPAVQKPVQRAMSTAAATAAAPKPVPFQYPAARRTEFTEDLHGAPRADPYRWMEEKSDELKTWVNKQNDVFNEYIAPLDFKDKMHGKIKARMDYPKHGLPFKIGKWWYYYYNTGLQNQHVLYQKEDIFDKTEEGKVFLDPNTLAEDGTAALGPMDWTEDGRYLAYGIKKKGSDWSVVYVKDCDTGEDLPDKVEWVKYSGVSWSGDGKGFFYSCYPVPESLKGDDADLGAETDAAKDQRLQYHFLGTKCEDDLLIYYDAETPDFLYSGGVTEDGKYCVIHVSKGCDAENKVWYIDMTDPNALKDFDAEKRIVKLVDDFEWQRSFCGNDGSVMYFITTENAGKKKVVSVDVGKPGEAWATVIPEEDAVLESCEVIHNKTLLLGYQRDVKDITYVAPLSDPASRKEIPLEIGSVGVSSCIKHPHIFLGVTSFTFPKRIYHVDLSKPETLDAPSLWHEDLVPDHDSSLFEVEQVFYPSKDGTKVPMYLVYKKTMKRDGNNLAVMYGYGGFHVSMDIGFSTSRLMLLNNLDGIYVQVNIRGGCEYGEEWWKGGALRNKQNCYDDFAYAAKWLHENKITNPDKLVIQGGSNGGTLVAATANQYPELFRTVLCQVGVLDMTRFHKFTIGAAWRSDFGDPDKKDDYEYILTYSPYHNIDATKKYPAVLVATADHDDRVVPLHSFKYLAKLQHACGEQTNPLMARFEIDAGHGAGKPTAKIIQELTDMYAFVARTTEATWME